MKKRPDFLAHAVLLLGVLLFMFPIWVAFAGATQSAAAINRGAISLVPDFSKLGVFVQALSFSNANAPVWHMLLVSFFMALAIAIGKIVISALSAFAIAFFRFPLRMVAFWLIFITLMLPIVVRIVPTYAVMSDLHLIDTFPGLTLPLIASATATLLFRQIFIAVPDELVEAAKLDGAGPMRFFWDVLLPVSRANIAALFVIEFVYGWNQYLWPLLVTTKGGLNTIVIGIVQMITGDQLIPWNLVMATTILALLPPILVVLAMQRWFVAGLTEADK
ncbi:MULTISPECIES: sn-glycerol-3-phosphate ABC transporter permease UgpE [Acidocella]|uniref:sn-glycerol-3-phosphate ABC transporter permease UgpE n=1 Tax=Acidocella TaxID=50709 RepID=UPI00028E6691|nr:MULTISPECIES: sn-glycerol-3-phosphate ABC transporter permease UgpE [Acidocella]EKM98485.1 sn-glycerol-3-phosphate ABC transporter permease [Acidocella sp. MX-AZ02]WBO59136.1 sn-glycerol-3-phosphate ABC transporter permease UgpE [Acidocella sp. MX-AZ03]